VAATDSPSVRRDDRGGSRHARDPKTPRRNETAITEVDRPLLIFRTPDAGRPTPDGNVGAWDLVA